MPFLKPINPEYLCGTAIKTINSNHRKIYFMKPCLGSRGLEARKAQEKYEEIQKRGKLDGQKELEYQKELEDAALDFLCSILRQQYSLQFEKSEEIGKNVSELQPEEINQIWRDTISNYFVEGDIGRIIFSMRLEKEFSCSEMLEEIKRQQAFMKENEKMEQQEKN